MAAIAMPSPRKVLRWLVVAICGLLVAAAAGAIYQSIVVRRALARYPPPGRLVDIGGRRLHLVCIGEGSPTVIFESGGFGGALSSSIARQEIAAVTRVCSYDRMGMNWSDPGPAVITAAALTDDLERLIDRGDLRPPFILVPASIGGLTAEMYLRRHPDRVAGAVFLDAATSNGVEGHLPIATTTRVTAVCLAPMAARIGLIRLLDPLAVRRFPADSDRSQALLYRPEPMATICGIARGLRDTVEQFHEAPPIPRTMPLTVLTAATTIGLVPPLFASSADSIGRDRELAHRQLAAQSSRGVWRVVPGSDHLIGNTQPHAVATAVLDLVTAWRKETEPKKPS